MTNRQGDVCLPAHDSYTYDIFGRLIGRELDANGDTVAEESGTFIYDGDQILLVLDDTGDVDHRLLWGAAVDQILADENSSGDVNWMLTDHQNTVRDIVQYDETTDTTAVVSHLAYDAFGNVTTETDPSLDVFNVQYTARYFDEATGLQYNNARWYDAVTGRWMSQDPIGFEAGDDNLYRYVLNQPTHLTDPSGLSPPGFWSGYWHYLTNPWEMDKDLEYAFYASAGTAAVAGAGAGGLAYAGYGSVTIGQAALATSGATASAGGTAVRAGQALNNAATST